MTREEAIRILSTRDAHGVLCGYTSGVTEAIDMAIEALSAVCDDCIWHVCNYNKVDWDVPSAEAVSKDAQTEKRSRFLAKETELACIEARLEIAEKRLQELPKYTNCTEFIEWLTEVVLNNEDWELNAVAYGEVIARKLKKLGLLEVKNGCYIRHIENNTKESDLVYRPSSERPTGEWVRLEREENVYDLHGVPTWGINYMCDKCGFNTTAIQDHFGQYKFCPNCGAKMKGAK